MPKTKRRKPTLREKVLAHARSGAEKRETPADEKRESAAWQREERRQGVERHKVKG